ncbi:MAG: YabP/YqfC family sporulation protein [Oscillospiraceae bacterium]|nr:YabP/YqfC family sporulation protein [Oscillospiraceae bacterium]
MKRGRELAQTLLSAADFPGEILTGVPVVEWKGTSEAVIISHRGIIAYDPAVVRVATSIGPLTLTGEALTIFRMNRERMILHGVIRRIEMGDGG